MWAVVFLIAFGSSSHSQLLIISPFLTTAKIFRPHFPDSPEIFATTHQFILRLEIPTFVERCQVHDGQMK